MPTAQIRPNIAKSADCLARLIKKQHSRLSEKRIDRHEADGKIIIESPIDFGDAMDLLEENGSYTEMGTDKDSAIYFDDQFNAWVIMKETNKVYETVTRFEIR